MNNLQFKSINLKCETFCFSTFTIYQKLKKYIVWHIGFNGVCERVHLLRKKRVDTVLF